MSIKEVYLNSRIFAPALVGRNTHQNRPEDREQSVAYLEKNPKKSSILPSTNLKARTFSFKSCASAHLLR